MRRRLVIACASIARPTNSRRITPISSKGALQKMPVPNRWSSHRPMNRPIRVGATMIQPRTPIWPTYRAMDGSPSRCHACGARARFRTAAAMPSSSVAFGSVAAVFTPASEHAGTLRAQIADDLADCFHLQLQALGPRHPLGFERVLRSSPERPVRDGRDRRPAIASRVAIATSLPLLTAARRGARRRIAGGRRRAASPRPRPSRPSRSRHDR